MRRFIVACINFYDYNMVMTEVKANSRIDAFYEAADLFGLNICYTSNEEEFKQACFDLDLAIEVYEIN